MPSLTGELSALLVSACAQDTLPLEAECPGPCKEILPGAHRRLRSPGVSWAACQRQRRLGQRRSECTEPSRVCG
jgi:hypothetical protein